MTRVATTKLETGDVCFALTLRHLHPDRELDAEAVTRDGVAFVTALEGQHGARFVLQTACFPDPRKPEHGRLAIHLLATIAAASEPTDARVDELCDDLLDLLSAPPVRWSFEPVTDIDELVAVLEPLTPAQLAEVARREEPCMPTRWVGGIGFGKDPSVRTADRPLWSMWTLGPASRDLRRLGSVLLAQEAPVCIRVSLTPSAISSDERAGIEALSMNVADEVPGEGLLRASWHTVESLLYMRPLFDVRCVVASPEPLSPSMLSALGHAYSEPPVHGAPEPVLRGGFAVLRGDHEVDSEILLDAYSTLSCGNPVPSLAPPGLERIRRLLGPWEAANIFRIPTTDEDGFPGLTTLRIPDLEVPLVDLAKSGQVAGHVVGNPHQQVLIDPEERFRHLYVSGQTGTGKSTLLLNLALQDIEAGAGVAVLDPHGDLVEALLGRIPPDRADDVVLVDPADPIAVTGVNLLEGESPIQREYVVSELARMFYSLFDPNRTGIIGPRYESWLRQAALLLLANPDEPSSFLDISTVFVDPAVRKHLVDGITDPVLAEFWRGEMAQTSDYHKSEVLGWFRSKFEVFRTSALVRNVVGQARSTVSFGDVMADQRILLVNLSKGLLGDYNSALIGHIVFSRLWSAALERAAVPARERRDFFIYIDEFQNMTTDSLPAVLSEARKFRVGLTLANQFFSQVPELTREAIMGNVGSRITFRLGPKDAEPFAHWLGPDVHAHDLTGLPNHLAVGALSNQGVPIDPFPFRTQPPLGRWDETEAEKVRERSREQWASPVETLDAAFFTRWAHVQGSFSDRLLTQTPPEPLTNGDSLRPQRFVERWITNRLHWRPTQPRMNLLVTRRSESDFLGTVALLRRRMNFDVPNAVEVALGTAGREIVGLQANHAAALRYELRCHGAEASFATMADGPVADDGAGLDGPSPIAELDLGSRTVSRLQQAGIFDVVDLATMAPDELLALPGFGPRALDEVNAVLASQGRWLASPLEADRLVVDDDLLVRSGLTALCAADRAALRRAAQDELHDRVIRRVTASMTDEQLAVFNAAHEVDPEAARTILDEMLPDQDQVVAEELERLQNEIRVAIDEILRELVTSTG